MTPHLWCQRAQRRGPPWAGPQQLRECVAFCRRNSCRSCNVLWLAQFIIKHTLWALDQSQIFKLASDRAFIWRSYYRVLPLVFFLTKLALYVVTVQFQYRYYAQPMSQERHSLGRQQSPGGPGGVGTAANAACGRSHRRCQLQQINRPTFSTCRQAAVCVCRPKNSYDTVVHGTSRHLNACHTDAPDSQAKWPFTSRRLEQTCIAIVCCPHYASRPRHRCQTGARRVRRPGTRRCRPRTGRPRPRTRATSRPGCPGQPPAAATLWPARPPHLRGARC